MTLGLLWSVKAQTWRNFTVTIFGWVKVIAFVAGTERRNDPRSHHMVVVDHRPRPKCNPRGFSSQSDVGTGNDLGIFEGVKGDVPQRSRRNTLYGAIGHNSSIDVSNPSGRFIQIALNTLSIAPKHNEIDRSDHRSHNWISQEDQRSQTNQTIQTIQTWAPTHFHRNNFPRNRQHLRPHRPIKTFNILDRIDWKSLESARNNHSTIISASHLAPDRVIAPEKIAIAHVDFHQETEKTSRISGKNGEKSLEIFNRAIKMYWPGSQRSVDFVKNLFSLQTTMLF